MVKWWLTDALMLENTLPLFEEQIWTQVSSSAKIARSGNIVSLCVESKVLSVPNVMDCTRVSTTISLLGTAK